MIPVVLSPEALEDLGAALLYLHERRPPAARRLREQIEWALGLLAEGAETELSTGEVVRRWVVAPYIVYYQRREDACGWSESTTGAGRRFSRDRRRRRLPRVIP